MKPTLRIQAVCNEEDMKERRDPFPPDLMLLETKAKPKDAIRRNTGPPSMEPQQQAAALPARPSAARAQGKRERQERTRAHFFNNDVVLTLLLCDHLWHGDGNSIPPIPYSVLGTVQRDRAHPPSRLVMREKESESRTRHSELARAPMPPGGAPPASSSITTRPSRRLR